MHNLADSLVEHCRGAGSDLGMELELKTAPGLCCALRWKLGVSARHWASSYRLAVPCSVLLSLPGAVCSRSVPTGMETFHLPRLPPSLWDRSLTAL